MPCTAARAATRPGRFGRRRQAEGGDEREGGQRHGRADEVELPDADLGGDHPDEVVDEADRRHAGHDQAGARATGWAVRGMGSSAPAGDTRDRV